MLYGHVVYEHETTSFVLHTSERTAMETLAQRFLERYAWIAEAVTNCPEEFVDEAPPEPVMLFVDAQRGDQWLVHKNYRIVFAACGSDITHTLTCPESLGLMVEAYAKAEYFPLEVDFVSGERIQTHWTKFECDTYPDFTDCDYAFISGWSETVRHGSLRHVHLDMARLQHITGMLYKTPDGRYLKIYRGNAETPSSIRFVKR